MSPYVNATTPYPWPYDGDLGGAQTALLVVLTADAGAASQDIAAQLESLAHAVRAAGGTVIVVRTTAPPPGGSRLREPVTASQDLPGLLVPDIDMVAGGVDGYYASDLDIVLRTGRYRRLILAGVGLETCVHSTMRDANDRGYECLLVVDACVPIDPSLTGASVSSIEMSGGIFGAVGLTAEVVAALIPVPALTPGDL
ncbi:cysteine hydrolase family protein [Cellulomonas sp. URHD0024]|uniref:cysteine hydrolase family protein n=1 Tax=Cellulomonas sp. URHD0024 TaxID=1302620 RepID=UPI00040B1857|nr:isochorismatase family protein [Cellulomonas sp. URHD0024]